MANTAYRIQIVADDAEVSSKIRSLVEAHGHTAFDSTHAEAAARPATDPKPDVLILTSNEQHWDHWNAALQTPAWRPTVVVYLSDSLNNRRVPAAEVLYRPVAPLTLMDVVTRSACKATLLLEEELAKLERVEMLPGLLHLLRDTAPLDGALLARVTSREWLCCAVSKTEEVNLAVGDSFSVEGSASWDMRLSRLPMSIHSDSPTANGRAHPTSRRFTHGVLLAVPVVLPSGEYYGELCAMGKRLGPLSDQTVRTASFVATALAAEIGAQQDNTLRERFISKLAHDLRTPLSTITAGADILLHRALAETETRVVQRIERGATRMASLIETLLESTRGRIG
jgi:signal transduction histidine kinase